jgi:nucleotide-binding universal stress UspA family protein
MPLFSHVLCPVDSSPFAARALSFAHRLTSTTAGELRVISVRPPLGALGVWAAHNVLLPPERPDEREQALAALRSFAQTVAGGSTLAVELLDGPIVGEILRVTREWPAELLVMGTHGASGFERWFLGSVTERVLRKTAVPVFTVPPFAPDDQDVTFRTVLCAFDRSDTARRALDHAIALTRHARGRLVVAHVVEQMLDEPDPFSRHFDNDACFRAIESDLREWYTRLMAPAIGDLPTTVELRCGKAVTHLLDVAAQAHADAIVIGTASASAVFGSTAHAVVRQAHVPVLVVPPLESQL